MSKEDDMLARELGKLGSLGGKLSDTIAGGNILDLASSIGYMSVYTTARFLPTERHQIQLTIKAAPQMILAIVHAFFLNKGKVIDSSEVRKSPYPTISGTIGSGIWNMNPAIVHAEIISITGETCTVIITGAAKEGLIKQHTAEKAVNQLAEALKNLPS